MSMTYSATGTPATRRASATSCSATRCGGISSRTCSASRGSRAGGRARPEGRGRGGAEPPGGEQLGRWALGDVLRGSEAVLQRADEVDPGREVPVQRRPAAPGAGGPLGQGGGRVLVEERPRSREDPLAAAARVRPRHTSHFFLL